jgi:hypothetical protein
VENEQKHGVAYMPWRTLLTAFEILAEHGLPEQIDRSVFRSFSGATQAELLTGMRSLGLINDKGEPLPLLVSLIDAKGDARRPLVRDMLHSAYADLMASDLTKTTPTMLNDRLEKLYAVSGSTKKKAVRFFLSAAEFAQVPVSSLLTMPRASGGTVVARKRRQGPKAAPRTPESSPTGLPATAPRSEVAMKVIALKSGGTLTVSGSFNPFNLDVADRAFIDGLIKHLQDYESTNLAGENPVGA